MTMIMKMMVEAEDDDDSTIAVTPPFHEIV